MIPWRKRTFCLWAVLMVVIGGLLIALIVEPPGDIGLRIPVLVVALTALCHVRVVMAKQAMATEAAIQRIAAADAQMQQRGEAWTVEIFTRCATGMAPIDIAEALAWVMTREERDELIDYLNRYYDRDAALAESTLTEHKNV